MSPINENKYLTPRVNWVSPKTFPDLNEHEIHIWRVSLSCEAAKIAELEPLLSPDELSKADRFVFDKDRWSYIAGRGTLRNILSHYVFADPVMLEFAYAKNGKPALGGRHAASQLKFNLTHAQDLMLVAVSSTEELGIDIESLRDVAYDEMAEQFFSDEEVAALRSVPKHLQTEAFFSCWTQKEAYIKALGEGLSYPLKQFTVSFLPNRPAALLKTSHSTQASRWTMSRFIPCAGYLGALAVRGHSWRYKHWDWKD